MIQPTELQHVIFYRAVKERNRQVELQAAGRFKYLCDDPALSNADVYAILGEEFGEVGTEVSKQREGAYDADHLAEELIQVIAVSMAWLERLLAPPRIPTRPTDDGMRPAHAMDVAGWDPHGNRI